MIQNTSFCKQHFYLYSSIQISYINWSSYLKLHNNVDELWVIFCVNGLSCSRTASGTFGWKVPLIWPGIRTLTQNPPVCELCTRGPRSAISTSGGPVPSPARAPALCLESACVHTLPLALLHSAPYPGSPGGGDGGGGAFGLWTGPCPGRGPCLCHLTGCCRCPNLRTKEDFVLYERTQ